MSPSLSPLPWFSNKSLVADIQTESSSSSSRNFDTLPSLSSMTLLRFGNNRLTCCHLSCTCVILSLICDCKVGELSLDLELSFWLEFVRFRRTSCRAESSSTAYYEKNRKITHLNWKRNSIDYPGDFRFWESPQTLPAFFTAGPFEHVERFQNLKFSVKRITNIQSTVLSSSESTAAIHPVW